MIPTALLVLTVTRYSESIHLLYETNVLDFSVLDMFAPILKLPVYIIPSRLRTFRSVHLNMIVSPSRAGHSEVVWRQVSDVLKAMTGLHSLVVHFQCCEVIDLVPFLEAMAGVKALKFRVFVQRRICIEGGPNPEVFPCGPPFTLLREDSGGKWEPWVWSRSTTS